MRAPLQSRKDIARIPPLSRKIVPQGETATGCDWRGSPRGGTLSITVSTEPRLVPTHNVGNVLASEKY